MTPLEAKTAKAILNLFETGKPIGDYGQVTISAGDKGQLTYGRSQVTLASGNLGRLIGEYAAAPGAAFGAAFQSYLAPLKACAAALNTDTALHGLLRAAGADPVMRDCQDAYFDANFWQPALRQAAALAVATPLGTTVIYDSLIHGNWVALRNANTAATGSIGPGVTEEAWIAAYVARRRQWLLDQGGLLARCTYRMDEFRGLMDQGKWDLALPIGVRGVLLDEHVLAGEPVRDLRLSEPPLEGPDVRRLQTALGIPVTGAFGAETEAAVRRFQSSKGLKSDGVVGPKTRQALGIRPC
jgi:chitosanase